MTIKTLISKLESVNLFEHAQHVKDALESRQDLAEMFADRELVVEAFKHAQNDWNKVCADSFIEDFLLYFDRL
jgi:hypothetical protein